MTRIILMYRFGNLYKRVCRDGRGAASSEFAIVLPTFLLAVMVVFALAIWLFSLLLAGAGVPAGARRAGIQGGGQSEVRRIMGVLAPAGTAAGSAHIRTGAPGCERAVFARLNTATTARLPLLGEFTIRLRAGSQYRDWRFWAGKPTDSCE